LKRTRIMNNNLIARAICATAAVLIVSHLADAGEAPKGLPAERTADPYFSDWQGGETELVARMFPLTGVRYQATLLEKFDTAEKPVAILEGVKSGETVTFSGDGWTAAIEKGHFKGRKSDETFDMQPVTRGSPTMNAAPPKGAIVLFDGKKLDQWLSQKEKEWLNSDGPATDWKIVPAGWLEPVDWVGSIITKKEFGDFELHVEFRLLGGETNSGVYLQARYEININDSYGALEGSQCGAFANLSTKIEPRVAMTMPPLQWQTFDIDFRAPRFDESGKRIEQALVTVVHNGVKIHDRVKLDPPRGAAKRLGEAPKGPIMLQEHGTPLQFRNIWIVDKSK
jgi:hypothetical protein